MSKGRKEKGRYLFYLNMLEVMAIGLAVPVLIIPLMLIILNASKIGPVWIVLLLMYLTLFTSLSTYLWRRKAKNQFHFLVGDEIYYRTYPKELQKALRSARREGIPPDVVGTLALYSDVTGGALSMDKAERKKQLAKEQELQFALDLFELGVIDEKELLYRLNK